MKEIYLVTESCSGPGYYIVGLFTEQENAVEAAKKHVVSDSYDGGLMEISVFNEQHREESTGELVCFNNLFPKT